VTVASAAWQFSNLTQDDIQMEKEYKPYGAYSNSKLMQVLSTQELARKLELDEVTHNVKVVSLHPGTVRTDINNSMFSS